MRCKAGMLGANRENGWDVQAATYIRSLSIADKETEPSGVAISAAGDRLYLSGNNISAQTGKAVHQYLLSTVWDISTAMFDTTLDISSQENNPKAIVFKPDGTTMYIAGDSGNDVNQYSLSMPWDISTATYVQNFSVSSQTLQPSGLAFSPDGSQMFVAGTDEGVDGTDVNEYLLATPWDISTASYVQRFDSVGTTGPWGLAFKYDGTLMYIVDNSLDAVRQFVLSTAWDVSTSSYQKQLSATALDSSPRGIAISPDGTQMYLVGNQTNSILQYSIT